jgi:hypothetical protein
LNNIYTLASELQRDDPRLGAFFQYIAGTCDVLVLHIHSEHIRDCDCQSEIDVTCAADERLFKDPVITSTALEKVLGEGCVQDMNKVLRGAIKLKRLAQKYTKVGVECIIDLSFSTLTQSSSRTITAVMRLSNVFTSEMSSPHDPGHRWVTAYSADTGRN